MYTASTPYESDGRQFTATIVAGTTSIGAQYVSSFSISESLSANNSITMGTVNSSKLELELVQLTPELVSKLYKGVKLEVSLKVTDTTTSPTTNRTDVLGYYYIDEIELGEYHIDNLKTAKITAYDGFSLTEKPFTYSGSQNPTIVSLIGTIATACNISYKSTDWSDSITVSEYPEDVTYRTMIGYLAGLQGTVAYFTRDDKLGAKWYTNTSPLKTITRDEQYADALEIGKSRDSDNSTVITIKYLESGTSDGTVVYPSDGVVGQSISFENPLITDVSPLQTIYNAKVKSGSTYLINFTPMTVKWRGNATIECGEIVTVKDRNDNNLTCYIMEREMTYDGGFSESYKCLGENEKTVSFTTNPVMQRLNRTMSVMEQEIAAATEAINDATAMQDGVFSFIPNSTNTANVGWNIKSSTTNKVITANINGIGFSPDGGATYNTAIYVDSSGNGHIVGSYITASSISADKLTFSPITTTNLQSSVDGLTIQGSTITSITAIPGYLDLMTTVDSKATPEQAAAAGTTAATAQIASFTQDHDLTYIGSDGIYTGTITAQQLNVGWQGGNYCSCKWTGDTTYFTFDSDSNNYPRIKLNSDLDNSEKTVYSAPFYASKGARINLRCVAQNTGTSSSSKYIGGVVQYSSTPTGTFANKGTYWSTDSTSRTSEVFEYTAENGGYYRFRIWFHNCNKDSLVDSLIGTYTVTGTMVVTGSIKSVDGNTYFDLDNSEIVADNSLTKARLANGALEIYCPDKNQSEHKMRGILAATGVTTGSSTQYRTGLFYQEGNATYAVLGMRGNNTNFYEAMQVSYNGGNSYARIKANFGGFETVDPNGYKGKMGIGNPSYGGSSYKSAAIQVMDSNDNLYARLDAININASAGAIKCSGSPWLVLGSNSLSYNSKEVITTATDLDNTYIGGYKVATGHSFSDFMADRVSHIKIQIGTNVYTAYWS